MTMMGGGEGPEVPRLRHDLQGARFELTRFKERVREVIVEAVENGEVSKHYGNQMLEALDLERMPTTWRATVYVRINVTLESDEDEAGVEQELEQLEVAVTTSGFGRPDAIQIESFEVERVDDIEEEDA